ncbi:MAG: hypothetical protein LBQ50_12375 [Planctomycetaceae bacterium]|jgi:hypothetical protein|nr:hypothetical protein [Planctomycetaceae bacterium]
MTRIFLTFFCVLYFVFCFCNTVVVAESERLEDYYSKAIPAAEGFIKRLVKNGKTEAWDNLGVRSLIDQSYLLALANVDLPEGKRPDLQQIIPLLNLAEEMQDQNPESRTFGNFRWYWRTPEVTDHNAVEFVASHALPIWFEVREKLPPEARLVLARMLRRSVDGCLKHRVRSDYTNIAIYNFVHLIILGQIFDRPDAVLEGERRLQLFLLNVWDHGIFEYNSPTYYTVDVDALQLGLRYIKNTSTKRAIQKLLELFWTDLALNWYKPSLRHAGAQSRTYNYLYGVGGTTRLFDFAGLAAVERNARGADYLNSFHAPYKPDKTILERNHQYPRLIVRRWGAMPGQWATSYILNDIALGSAGAPYRGARQNMVLTVDLADFDSIPNEPPKNFLSRNYFIADGREDPYGTKRYPTSNAGHEKALHMEAFWLGAQRTVDALGIAVYTPETLKDSVLTNVQSHFVFRTPDAVFLDGNEIKLSTEPVEAGNKPVILRYGNKAFGIRVLWTRDKNGQSPSAFLINDNNKYGVYRLTINHWTKDTPISYEGLEAPPGAAFWVRIGSKLDSDEKFQNWCRTFAEAQVEKLEVQGDNIAIQVAGVDGLVSAIGTELTTPSFQVVTEPPEPNGILTLDGKDLGRPILEQIPAVAHIVSKKAEFKPVVIEPTGTFWEAESGFSFFNFLTEPNSEASQGQVVRINGEVFWDLEIKQPGNYYLWARVFGADPEHDSFMIDWVKQKQDGINLSQNLSQNLSKNLLQNLPNNLSKNNLSKGNGGAWHIGSGSEWHWAQLKLENEKPVVPMKLEPGIWRLTIRPREPDGLVDRFFLTTDQSSGELRVKSGK